MEKVVLYLYASQPIGLDRCKLDTLHKSGRYKVLLAFWDRLDSPLRIPYTPSLPPGQVFKIETPFVRKSALGRILVRVRVILWFILTIFKIRPSIVHACSFDCYLAARFSNLFLKGFHYIVDLQDTTNWMWKSSSHWFQRWVWKPASLVFVTSPQFDTHFLKRFRLVRDNVPVVFIPNSPTSDQMKPHRRTSVKKGGLVLGYIGGFRGLKTFNTLERAGSILWKEKHDFALFFAGVGFWRDRVEALAKKNSQVHYWGGFDCSSDMQKIYEQVDLVYACYDRDPDKMIHLACRFSEAIACEKPIIVGEGTFMAEFVLRHQCGLVVPFDDPAALAAAIRSLLIQPGRYQEMCDQTRHLSSFFLFDNYRQVLLDAYDKLPSVSTAL